MSDTQLTKPTIVMPVVSTQEALSAWEKYEDMKKAIVTSSDIQKIGDKDFLKKSYWRKIATFFNLSIEVVNEKEEQIGKTIVWHFTCKAVAPNGRSAIGTGSCDAFEKAILKDGKYMSKGQVTKWGKTKDGKSYPLEWAYTEAQPNSLHNIRSTAETRATNRAISNLVGGGEVSAEEVEQEQYEHKPIVVTDEKAQPAQQTTDSPTSEPSTMCAVHKVPMKLRVDGDKKWYDHRKQIDGVWNACKGINFIPQT